MWSGSERRQPQQPRGSPSLISFGPVCARQDPQRVGGPPYHLALTFLRVGYRENGEACAVHPWGCAESPGATKAGVAGSGSWAPAAGTIRNELHSFSVICNWATEFKEGGRPFLARNPVRKLKIPQEPNPRRPLATEARYKALLSVANQADPEGRLRVLLTLAWETGRRINAILHLRASDVLLTEDQVLRTLAEEGQDESLAEYWPRALRWRAEFDKCKYLDFAPLPEGARVPLEAYLRRHPSVGEAWLFPANRDPSRALNKLAAGYYLLRAEKLAGLPHQKRGGWHGFRRAWATRRKALPVQDVMRAGGWRDVKALQTAYQSADPETVRRVLDMA